MESKESIVGCSRMLDLRTGVCVCVCVYYAVGVCTRAITRSITPERRSLGRVPSKMIHHHRGSGEKARMVYASVDHQPWSLV